MASLLSALERPLSAEPDVDNLLETQVTMHDHFTAQKLVTPAAPRHFAHGKRILIAEPDEARRSSDVELFHQCGVNEPTLVETGRQCLKSITVSRRNFESSPIAIDPAFPKPVACANFDFIFLAWEVVELSLIHI